MDNGAPAQHAANGKITMTAIPAARGASRGWAIDAAPHIAIRLKRLFPRVEQSRTGTIYLRDTPEIARDLEWVLERYPMRLDQGAAERLGAQAARHRATEEQVQQVLAGRPLNADVRTPARTPYPEQRQAADLAIATGRLLLGDDLGLGKTTSSLLVLRAANALPAVVVTLTHLPSQWLKELAAVFPDLRGHVITSTTVYDPGDADVLIMSYSKLAGWAGHLAGQIKTVIFDEIQELRHHTSDKYRAAGQLADAATFRVGLSATPVYNYGGEAFNVIDILAPGELGTRTEFLREWGSDAGNDRISVKDPRALGEHLRAEGLLLARTREEVGRPLPPARLLTQNVDGDPEIYEQLAGNAVEMAKFVLNQHNNPTDRWQQAGQMDLKLRQATGIAKAPAVAGFCRLLLDTETDRLVLWGWHRAVYDLWLDALADYKPVLYTGSETPNQKAKSVERFLDGSARVLIMSLRSGAGLDGLQMGCDTGVFGELDWSPQVHGQCIGRLRRDGLATIPKGYFCVSDQGSDPPMIDLLDIKRMQNDPLINPRNATVKPVAPGQNHIKALAQSLIDQHEQRHLRSTA